MYMSDIEFASQAVKRSENAENKMKNDDVFIMVLQYTHFFEDLHCRILFGSLFVPSETS